MKVFASYRPYLYSGEKAPGGGNKQQGFERRMGRLASRGMCGVAQGRVSCVERDDTIHTVLHTQI